MIFIILLKLSCCIFMALLFAISLLYIPIGYLISIFSAKWSIKITTVFSYFLWEICGWIFKLSFDIKKINKLDKKKLIIVSNHVGAIDFMILNFIFKTNGNMKYLIKSEMKWVPIFYQVVDLLKFIAVSRNYKKDKDRIKKRIDLLLKSDIPVIVVIFPEGTRINKENLTRSIIFCKNRGLPVLSNVLYPRLNGFNLIYEILKKENFYIADFTFTHIKKPLSLWEVLFTSKRGEIKYDLRFINILDIKNPRKWMEDCFVRKDRIIENLKNGE
ncbi:acylglycerol-3-phosphate acyltransferase-like protein [Vairimorpha ceranae]|uniref:Acylglycerol-3-phosphate acyltransferase-like protein n=1 Tax=Vairimorpha ceranae TaxID=40302 RepID=A0A0F9ZA57_9MICR|nr:acylglycerol-3-phosphate acyltransferase-like protein [Vairimorpha ceranae]KAF5139687.1 hypothetical protein G9O61_00g021600 [Vairimorpha ceranae]KAF5140737.1 hypothetical protein G9O61_00g010570 [Vairimorpha ceranae]KKO74689.1 acylglycerol-3-phosphate acyltransferase-like protein [Vairimorpha ceranae]